MRRIVIYCFLAAFTAYASAATNTNKTCLNYQFLCQDGLRCIDKISVCDGIKDCSDGSDETATLCSNRPCPKENFRCTYGACVSLSAKCDGRVDCADKSDENHPDCPVLVNQAPTTTCNSTEFQCKSGKCLDMDLVCDGFIDCADSSDETIELCANNTCPNKFRCDYGGCISNASVCDGDRACADGSDEFYKLCNGVIRTTTSATGILSFEFDPSSTTSSTTKPLTSFHRAFSHSYHSHGHHSQNGSGHGGYGVRAYNVPVGSNNTVDPPSTTATNIIQPSGPVGFGQSSLEKRITFHISTSNAANVSIFVSDNSLEPIGSVHDDFQTEPNPIVYTDVQDAPRQSDTNIQAEPSIESAPQTKVVEEEIVLPASAPGRTYFNSPKGLGLTSNRGASPDYGFLCSLDQDIGRNYTLKCLKNKTDCKSGENHSQLYWVPRNMTVSYSCRPGYVNKKNPTGESQCLPGLNPPITPCVLECPVLESKKHMEFSCFYLGDRIDCHGKLPAGAKVRPRCAPYYREDYSNFDTIECESNGKWTNKLFNCIPECGRIRVQAEKNVKKNSGKTVFNEAPWFAAVYRKDKKDKPYVCSGTIVSPFLIVSAAHCFYDVKMQIPLNAEYFTVAVSKYNRNYNAKGNNFTQTYQIQEIVFPPEYTGDSVADVALLRLKDEIAFNEAVSPACVRWPSYHYDTVFSTSEQGNIIDKAKTSTFFGTFQPEQIHSITCFKNLTTDIHQFVSIDELCPQGQMNQAVSAKGVLETKPGGGFLYSDPDFGQFYLLGVLRINTDKGRSNFQVTDLRNYLNWLDDWRKRVDEANAMVIS